MIDDDDDGDRSWAEYRRLVLSELRRLDKKIDDLNADIKVESARTDALEQKNTYRGGMLGAAVAFGGIIGWLLTGGGALVSLWDKVRGVAQ